VYQDMMIKGLATITDKENRNILMVTVTMRQLIRVSTVDRGCVQRRKRNQLNPMKTNASINLAQQNLRSG